MPTQTSKKVKIIGSLIIAFLLILALFLITELILRGNWRYARASYAFDQETIWRLRPNMQGERPYANWHVEGKAPFQLKLNDQGFRGEDWSLAKGVHTRIMLLGDSYTAGLDYPLEEIFSSQLEDKLNTNSTNQYQILNASCPAWGTDQEFLYWEKTGKDYELDYLVLMIAPNDVREAYNKQFVRFSSEGELIVNPIPIPKKERSAWRLANLSSTYQYLQKKLFKTNYGEFEWLFQHYQMNYGEGDEQDWDLPIFLRNPSPKVAESYDLLRQFILNFQAATQEKGVELVLCTIPVKTELESLPNDAIYMPGRVANYVDSIAQEAAIPHLNLYQQLQARNPQPQIIQHWEYHLNTEGHNFVAEELANFLHSRIKE